MEIVNGYVCRNCTDIDLAKRFIDPAHPNDPRNPYAKNPGADDDKKDPATALTGVQPLATSGDLGRNLNLFA